MEKEYNYDIIRNKKGVKRVNKGIDIDGCIILQLNKTSVKYTEYGLDFSNPDDLNYINMCEKAFLELAMLYHQIHFVKELYPW